MPTYKGSLHRISDAQRCAIVDIFQNYYKIYPNFKFVSYLRQVGGFLLVSQFPPPIKMTATIY